MELKDFIKNTLAEIITAIKEGQSETEIGGYINPSTDSIVSSNGQTLYTSPITNVDFDIAISESNNNSGGIGISVISPITMGYKNNSINNEISRIKFSIPLSLPSNKSYNKKHG